MECSPELIREWKKTYGQVFSVDVRGQPYVFRPLTYKEFQEARQDEDSSADIEEEIVQVALLHPDRVGERVPAGVITAMSTEILKISGFGAPKYMQYVLENLRQEAEGNVWVLMKAMVMANISSYREEELDNMTFSQLAAKVVMAEQIIKIQQVSVGVTGHDMKIDIIDPEEQVAREEAEKRKHASRRKDGEAGYDDPIARKLQQAFR